MPRRPPAVPNSLLRLASLQEGLVSADQCREQGVTRSQVAGSLRRNEWRLVVRGVYDVGLPVSTTRHELDRGRRRSAVLGVLAHRGSIATGLAALVLHEVQGAPARIRPEVTVPTGAPRATCPPVRLRRIALDRWDVVAGLRVAAVPDALVQAVPELGRRHAVALLDSALHREAITPTELTAAHAAAARRPGVARTHGWWSDADARAESPAETWARLSCVDLGFPPDTLQLAIAGRDARVFARVDLAWVLPGDTVLLVEIDGRDVHSTPGAVFADRDRQNRLVTPRTIVRRFTGSDAWNGRVGVAIARLLTDAGWRPAPLAHDAVLRVVG
ncbi:hypothetical protein LEP48_13605 [Isoptericola sp. NEAU-Y5]|uniref:Transcriptional regulator, AbiEi antitoxin, Type IV TA system n=1 Tax=Isoptericola luteus TaxID=2879484 RepID=A0ABS7ZH65_9MICO|nr:hypothetical protein [Isoptericola sp. NEAU-Y5]MCA5894374.1 hypothetical protein [Isoptericola sp. NEAU-Y5]